MIGAQWSVTCTVSVGFSILPSAKCFFPLNCVEIAGSCLWFTTLPSDSVADISERGDALALVRGYEDEMSASGDDSMGRIVMIGGYEGEYVCGGAGGTRRPHGGRRAQPRRQPRHHRREIDG